MTSLQRIDFHGTIELLTPLHIGSGEVTSLPVVGSNTKTRAVALIVRDHENKPFIPATSLKGVMLRLCPPEARNALFGVASKDFSAMGSVLFRGSRLLSHGHIVGSGPDRGHGVYLSARTALDAGTGSALTNHLFTKEMVGPGATFEFRLRLESLCDPAEFSRRERVLRGILQDMMVEGGLGLGSGDTDSAGRVRLAPQIERKRYTTQSGKNAGLFDLNPGAQTKIDWVVPQPKEPQCRLSCFANGLFLIADGEHSPSGEDGEKVHLLALRDGNAPEVLSSSVSGVLRARLAWLFRREKIRSNRADDGTDVVDRVFGKTGFKGTLQIRISAVTRAGYEKVTSIQIDRFTGAVIENALYVTEADRGVEFLLEFYPDSRASSDDLSAINLLKDDLLKSGLMLGHGTSRGFGWFAVKEVTVDPLQNPGVIDVASPI